MPRNKPNIVITGGTRGLGFYTAKYLSKLGWNLIIIDISPRACSVYKENKNIKEVQSKLSNNNNVNFYFGDLTKEQKIKKLFKKIIKKHKTIDGLVTFAGGDISGKDKKASGGKAKENNLFVKKEEFSNIFERNFLSTFFTLRSCIPIMKKEKKGRIVTISSVLGTFGSHHEYAYAASKSTILHLTRASANYCREWNINVNCIAPSGITSGRFLKTMKSRSKHDLKRLEQKKNRLLGFGYPEDVAKCVYFLLSDLSPFISGQVIRLDGGELSTPV